MSDVAVGFKDLELALSSHPVPNLGSRESVAASNIMSLKLALGVPLTATECLSLFGPTVTKAAKSDLHQIKQIMDQKLVTSFVDSPLSKWAHDSHVLDAGYSLFGGHASYVVTQPPSGISFSYSKTAERDIKSLVRECENIWREEREIPRVGEGWVSETKLFYEIKNEFSDHQVIQHASPPWLGRQHLDIFIPSMMIGIEYQGVQHDQPVAFFGGIDAYETTRRRDKRKRSLCTRHGVTLLYVREGYNLAELTELIRSQP